jgi:hypothetical protein
LIWVVRILVYAGRRTRLCRRLLLFLSLALLIGLRLRRNPRGRRRVLTCLARRREFSSRGLRLHLLGSALLIRLWLRRNATWRRVLT